MWSNATVAMKNEPWGETVGSELIEAFPERRTLRDEDALDNKRPSSWTKLKSSDSTTSTKSISSNSLRSIPSLLGAVASWGSLGSGKSMNSSARNDEKRDTKRTSNNNNKLFELRRNDNANRHETGASRVNNDAPSTKISRRHSSDGPNLFLKAMNDYEDGYDTKTGFMNLVKSAHQSTGAKASTSIQHACNTSGGFRWPSREELLGGKEPVAAHKARRENDLRNDPPTMQATQDDSSTSMTKRSNRRRRRRRMTVIGGPGTLENEYGKSNSRNECSEKPGTSRSMNLPSLTNASSSGDLREYFMDGCPDASNPFEVEEKESVATTIHAPSDPPPSSATGRR